MIPIRPAPSPKRVVVLAVVCLGLVGSVVAQDTVGRVTLAGPGVEIREQVGSARVPVRVGRHVQVGQSVTTDGESSIQVLFGQDVLVSLGRGSRFRVDEPFSVTDALQQAPVLTLERGILRVLSLSSSSAGREFVVAAGAVRVAVGGADEVVIELPADGGTEITPLGGDGTVRWSVADADWRDLVPGARLAVGAGPASAATMRAASGADRARLYESTLPTARLERSRPRARQRELFAPDSYRSESGPSGR